MGARMLADDDIRVIALPSAPANIDAITVTEATDASIEYLSDRLLFPLNLDATESDRIPERVLDESSAAQAFGKHNATGEFVAVRSFDAGQIDDTDDPLQLMTPRGTLLHVLVRRGGKRATEVFATGDEYDYFLVETDNPINQSGETYHKDRVPLTVKRFAKNKRIVAGS